MSYKVWTSVRDGIMGAVFCVAAIGLGIALAYGFDKLVKLLQ